MSYDEFIHDKKAVDAIIQNLEIMGEATRNTLEDIKSILNSLENNIWRGASFTPILAYLLSEKRQT